MKRAARCGLVLVVALALAPPAAEGHGFLSRNGNVLRYTAPDPVHGATLTISSPQRGKIEFLDTTTRGGFSWGTCIPISERRALCNSRGVSRIEIEVYDGNDVVIVRVPTPVEVTAGSGDDRISGGYGADKLSGGSGNDVLSGGEGADTLAGAEGDDLIEARDGQPDSISCGSGSDSARTDPADPKTVAFLFECEGADLGPAPDDARRPVVRLAVSGRLALSSASSLAVDASMDEPGTITVGGRVLIDGRRAGLLRRAVARPDAPGQVWTLRPGLSESLAERVRAALRQARPVIAVFLAHGRDAAANTSSPRRLSRRVVR